MPNPRIPEGTGLTSPQQPPRQSRINRNQSPVAATIVQDVPTAFLQRGDDLSTYYGIPTIPATPVENTFTPPSHEAPSNNSPPPNLKQRNYPNPRDGENRDTQTLPNDRSEAYFNPENPPTDQPQQKPKKIRPIKNLRNFFNRLRGNNN